MASNKPQMTPEERRQRHIELHRAFDELLAHWLYCLALATLAFKQGYEVSEEQMRELVAVRSKEQAITLARRWWPGEWLEKAELLL